MRCCFAAVVVSLLSLEQASGATIPQPIAEEDYIALYDSFTGGADCTHDFQCGLLAANAESLRQDAPGTGGTCQNGKCACAAEYTCGTCHTQKAVVNPICCTVKPGSSFGDAWCQGNCAGMIRNDVCDDHCSCEVGRADSQGSMNKQCVSDGGLDYCETQFGGGACDQDSHCFSGLCIAGVCSCNIGYACPYCTQTVQNLREGARCPSDRGTDSSANFVTGGAPCTDATDCGTGSSCFERNVGEGKVCQCSVGFGCADCSQTSSDLINGAASCGCADPDPCLPNGYCAGSGQCRCYWPYSGIECDVLPCSPDPCTNHENSVCVIAAQSSTAVCECTNGYSRDNDTGECTVEPSCSTNADCGVFAPIPQATSDQNFACLGYLDGCVEDKYGGTCNVATGQCTCNNGFTGTTCTAKGYDTNGIDMATGGGVCTGDSDCQSADQGNYCVNGRCVCKNGFTCPMCNFAQQSLGTGQVCPVAESGQQVPTSPGPARAPTPPTPAPTPCNAMIQDCPSFQFGGMTSANLGSRTCAPFFSVVAVLAAIVALAWCTVH